MSSRSASSKWPDAPVIVWFRTDLRVSDNAALAAAAESGRAVIALYIRATDEDETVAYGGAQLWWLHHSLTALKDKLSDVGIQLVLRQGKTADVLNELIAETNAGTIVWNRRYAPAHIKTDKAIKSDLADRDINVLSYEGQLLHEPTQVKTGSGGFYKVYTPFWRSLSADLEPRPPVDTPKSAKARYKNIKSDDLSDWNLLPVAPDWSGGISEEWTPGEDGAQERLARFADKALDGYGDARDIPSKHGTSKLSPHLSFGEITPYQIWDATRQAERIPSPDMETFRKELVWREFSYHLLVNVGDLKHKNYNDDFNDFPWITSEKRLTAWKHGRTGYPIVDAGMRQLWQTGWMHNRVRMIVGSFLVKHLLIDWREGEKWFWDTLVDADVASNTAGWQWIAGSGADAAPYFRIFNPILQGEKFDADGDYVKLFVPELVDLQSKYIHKPWEAPDSVLAKAGVTLGETYPEPIVKHADARERALQAYKAMKGENA